MFETEFEATRRARRFVGERVVSLDEAIKVVAQMGSIEQSQGLERVREHMLLALTALGEAELAITEAVVAGNGVMTVRP